jgi:hypothetical protein
LPCTDLQGHLCGIVLPVDFIGFCLQRFGLLPLEVRFPRFVGEEVAELSKYRSTHPEFEVIGEKMTAAWAAGLAKSIAVQ